MLLTAALILMALVAIVLITAPHMHDFPVDPKGAPQYKPGVRIRAGHLVRVMDARAAVRGDDGYVRTR